MNARARKREREKTKRPVVGEQTPARRGGKGGRGEWSFIQRDAILRSVRADELQI